MLIIPTVPSESMPNVNKIRLGTWFALRFLIVDIKVLRLSNASISDLFTTDNSTWIGLADAETSIS